MPDEIVRAAGPRGNDVEQCLGRFADAEPANDLDAAASDEFVAGGEPLDGSDSEIGAGLDATPSDAEDELVYEDELAQDDLAGDDSVAAGARARGRRAREGALRCELLEALAWYLRESDPESYDCLHGACRAMMAADNLADIDEIIGRMYDAEFGAEPGELQRAESLEYAAALLAIKLDLLGDASSTSTRQVANRFRRAKDRSLR